MSLSNFAKDHGGTISRLALAASIAFAAYTVGSRFDQIKDLAETANDTINRVQETQESLRADIVDLKAHLPAFGETAGEAGANAVTRMEEMLRCDDGQENCNENKGVRGVIRNQLEKLTP